MVCEAHVCHAGVVAAGHGFELGDDVLQAEGFAGSLRGTGFEGDVDDVDVEVVVCGLI